jgi:mono/diheme cytochrome c family protein
MSNGAGACKVLRAKLSLFLLPLAIFAAAPSGEAVYQRRCSRCHEQTSPRLPHREALQQMPLARILRALASSAMMSISFTMSREDLIAVASYQGTDSTTSAVFGENKVHFGALLSWAKQEGLEA